MGAQSTDPDPELVGAQSGTVQSFHHRLRFFNRRVLLLLALALCLVAGSAGFLSFIRANQITGQQVATYQPYYHGSFSASQLAFCRFGRPSTRPLWGIGRRSTILVFYCVLRCNRAVGEKKTQSVPH